MRKQNHVPLFYWSEIKFIFREKENYGDLLSKYLVERISGLPVIFVHPKKQSWYKWNRRNYLAIGSIIHHATKDSIVWGSGIIDEKQKVAEAEFKAVRGPRTRAYLMEMGYECPAVYGDPALLLPMFYYPEIEKRYKLGIIPHYHDYYKIVEQYGNEEDIHIVDLMTLDIEDVTRQILKCEKVISSSLHGLIVAQAYNIPSIWVEFSNRIFGDGVKYKDYLESVKIDVYQAPFLEKKLTLEEIDGLFGLYTNLPTPGKIQEVQENLLKSCPFKIK